jgi:hypothetical protein
VSTAAWHDVCLYLWQEKTAAMLRISNLGSLEEVTHLRLDGTLSGPWVEELRDMCEAILSEHSLAVDCGGLSFADPEGAALMRDLRDRDVALNNCSPFLMMQVEKASVCGLE